MNTQTGPRVTGLGGVFYVAKDTEATRAWYRDKLGVDGEYGPQLSLVRRTQSQPLFSHQPFQVR